VCRDAPVGTLQIRNGDGKAGGFPSIARDGCQGRPPRFLIFAGHEQVLGVGKRRIDVLIGWAYGLQAFGKDAFRVRRCRPVTMISRVATVGVTVPLSTDAVCAASAIKVERIVVVLMPQ